MTLEEAVQAAEAIVVAKLGRSLEQSLDKLAE